MSPGLYAPQRARRGAFHPSARAWFLLGCIALVVNALGWWRFGAYRAAAPDGSGPLQVVLSSPKATAHVDATVRIVFDRPMALPADQGKRLPRPILSLSPRTEGVQLWVSDRELQFRPSGALRKATSYSVALSPQIRALDGSSLDEPLSIRFETPRLTLLSAEQGWAVGRMRPQRPRPPPKPGRAGICLRFDDMVRPAALREKVSIRDDRGRGVEFEIDGTDGCDEIELRVPVAALLDAPLLRGEGDVVRLHLRILAGLAGEGGPLPMPEVWRDVEVSNTALRVTRVDPRVDASGDSVAYICLTDSVDGDSARGFISLSPSVAVRVESDYSRLRLVGPFRPATTYTLTLSEGLTSVNGMKLLREVSLPLTFSDRPATLRFAHPGMVLSRAGAREMFVDSVNYSAAAIRVSRLYPNNVVHYLQHGSTDLGWAIAEEPIAIQDRPNEPVRTAVDVAKLLDGRPNGAYLVRLVRDAGYEWDCEGRIVLATDLAITAKVSGTSLAAWVTSIAKAWPVAGVAVRVLTATDQEIGRGVTDAQGVAVIDLPATGDREPFLVTASLGDDFSFLRLSDGVWDLRGLPTGGLQTLTRGVRAFLFTDRGVYRRGEEVRIAGLLRDPQRRPPAPLPVDLCVERDDKALWQRIRVTPDDQGSFDARLAVPRDARTGMYRAWVAVPGEEESMGQVLFQVEDFVPERMKVEVEAPAEPIAPGASARVTVRARHLFGAPASGRQAEAEVSWRGEMYTSPAFPDHRFGDPSRTCTASQRLEAGTIDAEGACSFDLTAPTEKPPALAVGTVRASVLEPGGRASCASATVRVFAYPTMVGLCATGKGDGPGTPREIDVVALTPDGAPAGVSLLRVRVDSIRWTYALRRDDSGVRYDWTRIAEPLAEGEVALVGGRGTYRFTPPDWGDYVVTVEDPEGGMRSAVDVHTWGGDHAPTPERERVRVRLDRDRYAPGDTIRARIETPFDGTALVCLERDRVFAWKSVPVKDRTAEVEFRLPDGCAPNLYCTVTVVRPVGAAETWRPHRVCGVETVVVDTDPHLVDVEVEAATEARPGQPTEVTFRVTSGGRPVPGAVVTVAAVDEGILQLTRFRTPDPFAAYWGKEALQVGSRDLFPLLFPELAGAARSEPGGGEGGSMVPRTSPVRAERFVSAALWFPRLRTDDDGRAVVSAVLPTYIGELRWMAVAARDDAFGWTERPMTVTRPLLMEVSAPRFAATGDRFEATVTVRNRSDQAGTVHLSCCASGGVECLDGNARTDLLAAGGERTWRFPLRCDAASGAARLDFRARMGTEIVEEAFPLPIRPPCERVTMARTGRVDRGSVQAIDVPVSWIEGTGKTRLVLSAKPGIRFAGDLKRLLVYPYGCVEQTTSRAFPLLYVDDLLRVAQPLDAEETNAGELVRVAMERLESMRTRSGGLAMWPGDTEAYDWGTAYAGHFLVEAKRAGHATPPALLDGVLRHLRVVLSERAADAHDLDVQAYAAFVLSAAGAVRIGDLTPIRDRADELSPTARGHLAAALAAHGRTREAAALLADMRVPEGEHRDTAGALHSTVRDAALLLSVLLDILPEHPKVGELAERLDAASVDGGWATTQETAFALVALGKYAAQARGASTTLTGLVRIGEDPPRPYRDLEEVIVEWPQDAHGGVEVHVEGTGVAFWRWESEGVPEAGHAPEVDKGLRVRRAFLGTDGKAIEARSIVQGEVVVVELTVESDAAYRNCVVKDLLPSGFEVENPRLADRGGSVGRWMGCDYAEYLDDRVSIVFTASPGQPRSFRYAMRAVTPGTFVMAPSEASCMYDPRPMSRWGRVEWEVTPR